MHHLEAETSVVRISVPFDFAMARSQETGEKPLVVAFWRIALQRQFIAGFSLLFDSAMGAYELLLSMNFDERMNARCKKSLLSLSLTIGALTFEGIPYDDGNLSVKRNCSFEGHLEMIKMAGLNADTFNSRED